MTMPHTTAHRLRSGGFTLIELIVVIGLLAVVTAMGTRMFSIMTQTWNETRAMTELDAEAERIFDSFGRDVENTLASNLAGQTVLGVRHEIDDPRIHKARLDDDSIVIPVQGTAEEGPMAGGGRVRYTIDRVGGRQVLTRTIGPFTAETPQAGRIDVSGRANVTQLRLEYADSRGNWHDRWTQSEHPRIVRMNITLEHPTRSYIEITRKAAFFIHVR